ncbi:Histidine--tRNA ligase [Planctomycetes bacterium LzC2]|uniref:Histidine--tRNA ligase n=1 Tax=Alienimonas chondri TaxID=2681879 RepID=A0ABX1VDD3_9PLAN|nr:Histidine--tRNA ligase [Alienimonas chondri]
MTAHAKEVFRSYGIGPIDTPALEYAEILLGKGGDETDKQTFRFTDQGGRDVAMRFDLTVPFARFAAQHVGALGTPFKRYHIAPVWRGERPQKGRYREFVQCDFDTIGATGVAADAETVCVIHDLVSRISRQVEPSCGEFTIRLNHRGVLNGLLDTLGLRERATDVLRTLDKLPKVGADAVRAELIALPEAGEEAAAKLLEFAVLSGDAAETFAAARPLLGGSEMGLAALDRLATVVQLAVDGGCEPSRLVADLSIARGLDYYTGVIFETFLTDDPKLGSVCSGGRYDDLAGLYTKQSLPGVGASLGVDRLLAHLEEKAGDAGARPNDPRAVFVPLLSEERLPEVFALANDLRTAGFLVTVAPETRGLGKHLKWVTGRGFGVAAIIGDDEAAASTVTFKDLAEREQWTVARAKAAERLSEWRSEKT